MNSSENNSHQPDSLTANPTGIGNRRLLRLLFFLINFAVAVLIFVSAVVSIAIMESPGAFFGGVIGFLPFLVYASQNGLHGIDSENQLNAILATRILAVPHWEPSL